MRSTGKPHEPNAFTKFRLLMWKNFLQQWRHPIQTVMELLLPVLTTTLVLILRWQIEPTTRDSITYPPIPAHSLNYSTRVLVGMNFTELSFAYSPTSPELDDVVRSAMANLLIQNMRDMLPVLEEMLPDLIDLPGWPDLPNWNITWPPEQPSLPNVTWPPDLPTITLPPHGSISSTIYELLKEALNVTSYDNSEQLRSIYSTENITRKVVAAIQFSDSLYGATELSNNLSYVLRFPERPRLHSFYQSGSRSWHTDEVFPMFETTGPRFPFSWEGGYRPGYVNEMFIALQHFISTELIARFTGESDIRRFNVNIQRYPHPSYLEDMAVEALQLLLPSFVVLSFSYTAVNIARAVTVEKELQLKETMKIMGLPTWLHWTAWFCKQFIYLFIAAILIVVLVKVNWFTNEDGFGEYAVFTNTPWTVLLFFIILYLSCTIFFCFMMSALFSNGGNAALFTGIIWMLSYIPAMLLAIETDVSMTMQVFTCFSLNCAMSYGFQIMLGRESTGGLQWGEFMSSPSAESTRFVFGHVVIMLAVDCVLYMLIALYLEQILPGPFGIPQKWYFPVQKSFWFSNNKVGPDTAALDNGHTQEVIKEKDPMDHAVGVEIKALTKKFGNNTAVNNLSMNIYDDQITVLLGHNGAGKSTTMAMLTGNLHATYGSINLAGYDVASQVSLARVHLGFCPQHNVLFNELTVREHLEFFARLKGFSGEELNKEIDNLIEKLELQEKRDYQSLGLSGGQKRRLCVGIALSSAARVVLLDEPTSGMDPASRRALWDLLQKEKKGRSMILTTHFMDEADILGDRVAIMAEGKLQCVGSPFFLKKHYGVGYTLVVVKDEGFKYDACTKLIEKYIPGITIKEDRVSEVTYSLTSVHSDKFEAMLSELENSSHIINFKNYGLTTTTLEDVFMSVGSDVAIVNSSDDGPGTSDASSDDLLKRVIDSVDRLDKDVEIVSGVRLITQHVAAIWLKLWLVWIRSWWLVILQIAVPVLLINLSFIVMDFLVSFVSTNQMRQLTLEVGYTKTETLLSYNGTQGITSSSLGALARRAYELIYSESSVSTMGLTAIDNQDIQDYYLNRANDTTSMGTMRHSVLVGATFDDNSATAWFSNFGYHDVATSLATVHAAILKAFNSTAIINVFNYPLEATYEDSSDMQTMFSMLSLQLANGIGGSLGIMSAVFIMFYIKERACGAKLLQKASGVQPLVLWGSAAVFDWIWFAILCVTVVISCAAHQVIGLSTTSELGQMYLCILVYGAAMLPLIYLFSHLFTGPAMGFVTVFFCNVLFGLMGAQIVEALSAPQLTTQDVADTLDNILQFYPLYSLVTAVRKLNHIGLIEYSCLEGCSYMNIIMPDLEECNMEVMCEHFSEDCCMRPNAHLEWEDPGILRYLVVMLVTACVLWAVLMIIEYRIYYKIFNFKKTPPPVDESELNKDVVDEANHVKRINKSNLKDHGLVARDLSKYYGKNLAVDQVSFSVSDTECFGLLGVNGAGKTTTFKMLMGDETISSGEAFVSGYSVQRDLTNVHKNIGYCPQFDAVLGELTGRETLRVFSLLRGLRSELTAARIEILAQSLGFLKHLDKKVDQYSGGTKRKLNTAISFLGQTRLIFMDEPTTGVDPASKRHVWRAVRAVQHAGRGVVLTSHSMEECEALCSRLTIMVNGRFQCLGTPQHLKNVFSQGFTMNIKLRIPDDVYEERRKSITESVKTYVNSNFVSPRIMEEYLGLLTYYLPDRSIPWSRMFGIMERGKRELDIEDYNISQTTLEQIFLQFTKYQKEGR